ncbi:MAG: TrmH family RNA methyltransferase, partial [Spirochaetaceae bacterium]|nr:TrmH family RNA methyltransferase [Spirochaetaceae bacterium]
MITIRKLSKLPPVSALRKTTRLLQGFEIDLASDIYPNPIYLQDLITFILLVDEFSENELQSIKKIKLNYENNNCGVLRTCNNLRHLLLKHLNEEPADWDLLLSNSAPKRNTQDIKHKDLPFKIYLDDIRSPFNIGSI